MRRLNINILLSSLISLMCFASTARAEHYNYECTALLGLLNFNCGELEYYPCRCNNPIYVTTFINCQKQIGASDAALKKGSEEYVGYCEEYGNVTTSFDTWMQIYEDNKDSLITMAEFGTNLTAPLATPVIFSDEQIAVSRKTVNTFYFQLTTGMNDGGGLLAYWCGIIAIATIINFARKIMPMFMIGLNSRYLIKFRQWFVLPATFGFKHSIPIGCFKNIIAMATPTRGQSFVVGGYLIITIVLNFTRFKPFEPNLYWDDKEEQLVRYIADRTGITATTQIPIIFLFASRNNVLQWLTGWSFDTFNTYHRWIARVMVILAIVHSCAYTWLERDYLAEEYGESYWHWGVVATITGSFMLIQSIYILRTSAYEIFLALHILFGVFFTVGMWYHLVVMDAIYMQWMYGTIALWAFDRAARLGRLVWSGIGTSHAKLYPNDLFHMAIDYPGRWKMYPGAYVYLHIMRPRGFWESHPFTIYQSPLPENEGKIMISGTVKTGMTKKIANDIAKAGGSKDIKVLVDGPYGSSHDIARYDTVLCVCGGIGITAGISYLIDILRNKYHDQRLVLVWATRHHSSLDCFDSELKFLSQGDKCDLDIYITHPDGFASPDIPHDSSDEEKKLSDSGSNTSSGCYAPTVGHRPDLPTLISKYITESKGSTAVLVCGPPAFNDVSRRTVIDSLALGKGRVDYFEEAFSW